MCFFNLDRGQLTTLTSSNPVQSHASNGRGSVSVTVKRSRAARARDAGGRPAYSYAHVESWPLATTHWIEIRDHLVNAHDLPERDVGIIERWGRSSARRTFMVGLHRKLHLARAVNTP
jgi:hypothetical protein